eukprot:3975155-Lingulodinium_polyedra.AAC.1
MAVALEAGGTRRRDIDAASGGALPPAPVDWGPLRDLAGAVGPADPAAAPAADAPGRGAGWPGLGSG